MGGLGSAHQATVTRPKAEGRGARALREQARSQAAGGGGRGRKEKEAVAAAASSIGGRKARRVKWLMALVGWL